jgi:predicted RNA binding protein YcfA (HicA-like mRNA interferase family)
MKYSQQTWNQLKNLTADEIISALEKTGWVQDQSSGAILIYYHPNNGSRVTIHYHPRKTYRQGLLKGLLEDINWTEEEMRKIKLIK